MKTAVAILATGEYWKGAKVLFHTLRKYGRLPDSVDSLAVGMTECDFAIPVPIKIDYSWVEVSQRNFPTVANKFFSLTLPYDRIVMIDADMLCVGDCSLLWSEHIGSLPFYACRDTASVVYYAKVIEEIGLDHCRLFNAGTMIFQMDRLGPEFHDRILKAIREESLRAYDGGDQGYLAHYFQKENVEMGYLPPEYNCCLDLNMPQVPGDAKRLIHFCGGDANPWDSRSRNRDEWRFPHYLRWQREWEECNR